MDNHNHQVEKDINKARKNGETITIYLCDPRLNSECSKSFCAHNMAVSGECECTTKKHCAKRDKDGMPIVVYDSSVNTPPKPRLSSNRLA